MAPIGAVFLDVPDECFVRLVDQRGEEVDATSTDGSTAVAVEMVDARSGEVVQTVPRNEQGGFYCIFQPNKYVLNSSGLGSLLSLAVRAPSSACSSGGRRCRLSLPRPQLRRYLKKFVSSTVISVCTRSSSSRARPAGDDASADRHRLRRRPLGAPRRGSSCAPFCPPPCRSSRSRPRR